jgi:hypothetical protein
VVAESLQRPARQEDNRKPGVSVRRFQGSADADSGMVPRKLTRSKRPRTRGRRT